MNPLYASQRVFVQCVAVLLRRSSQVLLGASQSSRSFGIRTFQKIIQYIVSSFGQSVVWLSCGAKVGYARHHRLASLGPFAHRWEDVKRPCPGGFESSGGARLKCLSRSLRWIRFCVVRVPKSKCSRPTPGTRKKAGCEAHRWQLFFRRRREEQCVRPSGRFQAGC